MEAIFRYGKRTSLNYTAGETAVAVGDVVVTAGNVVAVANHAIAAGMPGVVDTDAVFELPRVASESAIDQGAPLYWDASGAPAADPETTTGAISSNPEDGLFAGWAAEGSVGDALTVLVKLGQLSVAPS